MRESQPVPAPLDRPCPFITFYSFKGGVGRSMAVINVAGIIASRGFRVLVIDMDLEAPGISYLANEAQRKDGRGQLGFVDFLLDAIDRNADADLFKISADEALSSYSAPYKLPKAFRRQLGGSLRIMPAGRLDDGYPSRLDRLDLPALYRNGSGLALIKAFKEVVQRSALFDYVFIDSRTGFSDESGICTRDLADYLMIVSGLNRQNVQGTTQFLSALRASTTDRKPLQVILSPVPNGEDALVDQREAAAQKAFSAAWGDKIQTNLQIPYHPQLALTEDPHIFRRRKGYLFEAYAQIERHLLEMLGETPEARVEEAIAALNDKSYATATALLQRANLLADTSEWIDSFAVALASTDPLPDVADAEAIYNIVIQNANPYVLRHLADRMGSRALALRRVHKDPDAAGVMFSLALQAGPRHVINLGNYANFLWGERKHLDAAEAIYKRIQNIDPKNADNLGNYANFRWQERKRPDAAEALYKRALEVRPTHANNLGNYASFLWRERKHPDAAEALYNRALEADPKNANNFAKYANFLWRGRENPNAAKAMYKRALEIDPYHANNLGNYGCLHLETDRVVEGLDLVDRALARLSSNSPSAIDAECWMYVYCCGAPDRRPAALTRLRQLIETHAISTDDWDFSGVIRQAQRMEHPEGAWLPILAEVLAGRKPITALDAWEAWRASS